MPWTGCHGNWWEITGSASIYTRLKQQMLLAHECDLETRYSGR